MKDKIKRIAQLLFDNAEYFADELAKTDNCRSLSVDFFDYKLSGSKKVAMWINGTNIECIQLEEGQVVIERIRETYKHVNENCGETPMPEPQATRESL